MSDSEFAIGDVVYHKSNPGVMLVVIFVYHDRGDDCRKIECNWISDDGNLHYGTFNNVELFKQRERTP